MGSCPELKSMVDKGQNQSLRVPLMGGADEGVVEGWLHKVSQKVKSLEILSLSSIGYW